MPFADRGAFPDPSDDDDAEVEASARGYARYSSGSESDASSGLESVGSRGQMASAGLTQATGHKKTRARARSPSPSGSESVSDFDSDASTGMRGPISMADLRNGAKARDAEDAEDEPTKAAGRAPSQATRELDRLLGKMSLDSGDVKAATAAAKIAREDIRSLTERVRARVPYKAAGQSAASVQSSGRSGRTAFSASESNALATRSADQFEREWRRGQERADQVSKTVTSQGRYARAR